jgi:superoxide reductase
MRKRVFERVTSNHQMSFSYNNALYSGIVTNLSENGMRIDTKNCPPFRSKFDVLFPLGEEVLTLPVQVKRVVKRQDVTDAVGVEILNPSMKYLQFVRDLKWDVSVVRSEKTDRGINLYTCKSCGHIAFDQMPTECPICRASIENFEKNPDAIKNPRDPENLTDFEKEHIPVINISKTNDIAADGEYIVNIKVGEICHCMKIENHIAFIDYYLQAPDIKKRCLGRVALRCDKFQPSVSFYLNDVTSANLTVISSCSAHGCWMSQTDI